MLLPQYIVLHKLHLYNHPAAVILPAVFSTFPVFVMYRGFTQIDAEILEAAWPLFVFALGQDALEEGIAYIGVKR